MQLEVRFFKETFPPCFAVKPFLNKEEYQRTESIVKAFENGIGKELQQKLLERAKVKRNWVRFQELGMFSCL